MRTDIAPTSGAAVLEVDIPTGYHTQKQVLRRHQWTGPIYSLRSRFVHQKVVLYFEFVSISVHVTPRPRRLVPESVYPRRYRAFQISNLTPIWKQHSPNNVQNAKSRLLISSDIILVKQTFLPTQ